MKIAKIAAVAAACLIAAPAVADEGMKMSAEDVVLSTQSMGMDNTTLLIAVVLIALIVAVDRGHL